MKRNASEKPARKMGSVRSKWTEPEEKRLQELMDVEGIAVEGGAAVPGRESFRPFAQTIAHRFGARSLGSIGQKVRTLLILGPVANKLPIPQARSVVTGLLGVTLRKQRQTSPPRSLHKVLCWPALCRRGPLHLPHI